MTRTIRTEPREAEHIRDPKDIRARIEAFANKPKQDFSSALFAALRRKGMEF